LGQVFKTLLPLPYETIFVNDACHANSIDVLKEFAYNDPRVVVIDLKETVGQQQAVFTGLKYLLGK
jgi:glycosyltransferase involved in cell wall biosynthesis